MWTNEHMIYTYIHIYAQTKITMVYNSGCKKTQEASIIAICKFFLLLFVFCKGVFDIAILIIWEYNRVTSIKKTWRISNDAGVKNQFTFCLHFK